MDKVNKFIEYLATRLLSELPGGDAHRLMMPEQINEPSRTLTPGKQVKKSAVLLLLYENGNGLNIVLTLRSKTLANHSGQISFPGGHVEKGEDAVHTALREANEEIGLDGTELRIIGQLTDLFVPPSNYVITPVIGYISRKPDYYINSFDEVEEILDLPLDTFTDGAKFVVEKWNFKGRSLNVPLWYIHDHTPLWGATSMILKELLVLYEEFKSGLAH